MVKYSFFMHHLSGKYRALFILAIFILLAGAIYTVLFFLAVASLLSRQMDIQVGRKSETIYQLLESCHVPYAFKHRYWTGLLLFAHIVLYIRSAVNEAGDASSY